MIITYYYYLLLLIIIMIITYYYYDYYLLYIDAHTRPCQYIIFLNYNKDMFKYKYNNT